MLEFPVRTVLAVSLLSAGALAYEVLLTRRFSFGGTTTRTWSSVSPCSATNRRAEGGGMVVKKNGAHREGAVATDLCYN
jgi:hypothetical protein